MPFRLRIDEQAALVLTDVQGAITEQDLMDFARALARAGERPLNALADFSEQTRVPVSPDAVRTLARHLHDHGDDRQGMRLALVGRSDSVFAMLRLFRAHREHAGIEVQVFRERGEALRWLGIDAQGIERLEGDRQRRAEG